MEQVQHFQSRALTFLSESKSSALISDAPNPMTLALELIIQDVLMGACERSKVVDPILVGTCARRSEVLPDAIAMIAVCSIASMVIGWIW
jgi:hypothetical protein